MLCLTETRFVKENFAKAHPQAKKGCCSEKNYPEDVMKKRKGGPFPASSFHGHITKQTPQNQTERKKTTPNLTTGHPRPRGKTDLHHSLFPRARILKERKL